MEDLEASYLGWFFRHRGILVSPPLILAFFCFRHEAEPNYLIWPMGIAVFLSGVAIRIWAQQHIHRKIAVPKKLTVTGPYKFVRNPLYIGNTLICLGATITSELIWLLPFTLLWCLGVYSLVIRFEESSLTNKYGKSYLEYLSDVPRWLPRNIHLENTEFINGYFRQAFNTEFACLLILVPYIIKEIIQ